MNPLICPTPALEMPISITEQPEKRLQNFVPVASAKSYPLVEPLSGITARFSINTLTPVLRKTPPATFDIIPSFAGSVPRSPAPLRFRKFGEIFTSPEKIYILLAFNVIADPEGAGRSLKEFT